MEKKLEVGAAVVFITSDRKRVNALVEVVHKSESTAEAHRAKHGQWPCINLLYLAPDESKVDPYGRQKERGSSVSHAATQGVPRGYCWMWPHEADALSPEEAELKPNN
jgi:hypothetical protein